MCFDFNDCDQNAFTINIFQYASNDDDDDDHDCLMLLMMIMIIDVVLHDRSMRK